MTISQGRHLNSTLHPTIQMSEQTVFRFMVLSFGTVYPKTSDSASLSVFKKRCIEFIHKDTSI